MDGQEDASQARKAHLSPDDYGIIVNWMEKPANYEAARGSAKKTTIGGAPKATKLVVFRQMTEHLYRCTKAANLQLLTAANMQQRWNTYKMRFKKAFRSSTSETGMGLSKKEMAMGLSVPAKFEQPRPHFFRMRDLFGEKANVRAANTVEFGLPKECHAALSSSKSDGSDSGSESESFAAGFSFSPRHSPSTLSSKPSQSEQSEIDISAEAFLREALGPRVETTSTDTALPHEIAATGRSRSEISATKIAMGGGNACEKTAVLAKKAKVAHSQSHESRVCLSHSYIQNSEARFDFYNRKLEQEDRHWKETQKENEHRRVFDMEQRQLERQDHQPTRNQELILELVKQGKTAADIREYFKLVEDMQ